MEGISFGGRSVPGFALGEPSTSNAAVTTASLMTGATVGLLAHVLKAPVGVSILSGVGAALITKFAIDKASA